LSLFLNSLRNNTVYFKVVSLAIVCNFFHFWLAD
jgi:hypothetical protein